jgi:4,5-DOPA dioxygenase extradiol
MNDKIVGNLYPSLLPSSKMPVFFVGHGSPLSAIEDNAFTQSLVEMGRSLPEKPHAILVISAHWFTRGTYVNTSPFPKTIYDFSGFPEALYDIEYPAQGAPDFAEAIIDAIPEVRADQKWGLDHGAWSVLVHMFPEADIPVFQMSIDNSKPIYYHFQFAEQLRELRDKGVLIIGSGNIVHNLRLFMSKHDEAPFDWAVEFDEWVKGKILTGDYNSLIDYEEQGPSALLAVPTTEHYLPMLYALALSDDEEEIRFTYEEVVSAISMRSFRIG